jgi:hypothetical protein
MAISKSSSCSFLSSDKESPKIISLNFFIYTIYSAVFDCQIVKWNEKNHKETIQGRRRWEGRPLALSRCWSYEKAGRATRRPKANRGARGWILTVAGWISWWPNRRGRGEAMARFRRWWKWASGGGATRWKEVVWGARKTLWVAG